MKCRYCGSRRVKLVKKWRMRSGRSRVRVEVSVYRCEWCGRTIRLGERLD
jgi:DNA-directed RNA polymerase subunit RPC12/RpoP